MVFVVPAWWLVLPWLLVAFILVTRWIQRINPYNITIIMKNPITFFVALALTFVFAWQFNNIFGISGNTDGFKRLWAFAPIVLVVGLKVRAEVRK